MVAEDAEQLGGQTVNDPKARVVEIIRQANDEYWRGPVDQGVQLPEFFADHLDQAGLLAKGSSTPGEWVSVKERLPKLYDRVLVYCPAPTNIFLDTFTKLLDGTETFRDGGVHVTHWQPFPDAPKGAIS